MRNRLAIEARPISTVGLQAAARSRAFALIAAVILMVAAMSWLATAAGARGMGGGSHGSHSFAGARSFGGAHSGARFGRHFFVDDRFARFNRFSRFSDRRFRNRFDGEFNNGFFPFGFGSDFGFPIGFGGDFGFPIGFGGDFGFPFGSWGDFGWPSPSTQLIQPAVTGDPPAAAPRPQRYEPPTVETTSSGVTIVRGPGSRHF
jgi:hypothetical protein